MIYWVRQRPEEDHVTKQSQVGGRHSSPPFSSASSILLQSAPPTQRDSHSGQGRSPEPGSAVTHTGEGERYIEDTA